MKWCSEEVVKESTFYISQCTKSISEGRNIFSYTVFLTGDVPALQLKIIPEQFKTCKSIVAAPNICSGCMEEVPMRNSTCWAYHAHADMTAHTSMVLSVAPTLDCSCPAFVIFDIPAPHVLCSVHSGCTSLCCLPASSCLCSFISCVRIALSSPWSVLSLPGNNLLIFSCFAGFCWCSLCTITMLECDPRYFKSTLNWFLMFHADACLLSICSSNAKF